MPDQGKSVPVNIELGARAEAKLSVETRIPDKSSGRFIDAITDILSPISETRGLKGDQLRLQREEVAFEITKKARDRIILESSEFKFVPTKVLVPLLEAASLEDPQDVKMHDLWAGLLASSAVTGNTPPRFVGVLKELQLPQAKLLEEIALHYVADREKLTQREKRFLLDASYDLNWSRVRLEIEGIWLNEKVADFDEAFELSCAKFFTPGVLLEDFAIDNYEVNPEGIWFDQDDRLDIDILISLGLIAKVSEITKLPNGDSEIDFWTTYFHLTDLGTAFIFACLQISK